MQRHARRIVLGVSLVAAAGVAWTGWSNFARADDAGVAVAQSLGGTSGLIGQLTGSVGEGGKYASEDKVALVPFLGANPIAGVTGAFDKLNPLSGFAGFKPGATENASTAITTKLNQVDSALGGSNADNLLDRVIQCGAAACGAESKVGDITDIRFRLSISESDKKGTQPFGKLPLPSMEFLPKGAGDLKTNLGWAINLNVIAAKDTPLRVEAVADAPELALEPSVTTPAGEFDVDLGILKVKATPIGEPGFRGKILVDFDGSNVAAPRFAFENAAVTAAWKIGTTADSPLQKIEGELHIDWKLLGTKVEPSGLTISLTNMKIDASKLVGEQISRIAEGIRSITSPLHKAASPFLEPIPGFSDVSKALGGDDVTLLRLAKMNGNLDPTVAKLIETLAAIDDALAVIDGSGDVTLEPITLVGDAALQQKGLPTNLAQLTTLLDKECHECAEKLNQLLSKVNVPGGGGGGFSLKFPVMEDPATLAGLLLGRDVVLVTFDTGRHEFNQPIVIPIIDILIFSVKIEGFVKASFDIVGGVDTAGIREAITTGKGDALLNGIFLENPKDNRPVVELGAKLNLQAAALLDLFQIEGGPFADVRLVVPKVADGSRPRLRPFAEGSGLGCALLREGEATIGIDMAAVINYPWGEDRDVLARHTFLTKADLCSALAPQQPIAELKNGVITIFNGDVRKLGPGVTDTIKVFTHHANGVATAVEVTGNNNARKVINLFDDKGAPVEVRSVNYNSAGSSRPTNFQAVRTNGVPFEFPVAIETGNGDDDVLLDIKPIATNVKVNGGIDRVTGGAANETIKGGPGDDWINSGPGVDIVEGEDGNDTLDGGADADTLDGGKGNDTLIDASVQKEPPTPNALVGGPGEDRLLSGDGADVLSGDEPNIADPKNAAGGSDGARDFIATGGGADVVTAGAGNDEVRLFAFSTPADDIAKATVYGNGGEDLIVLGGGVDEIYGGPDKDTISGGGGGDTIRGGDAGDVIRGGFGGDDIHGDKGVDEIFGDDGQDFIFGDDAGDKLNGGPGGDTMHGNAGVDVMHGDGGDDDMAGNAANDEMYGDADEDTMQGNAGKDTLSGGSEADCMHGNEETDAMHGDGGNDRMAGGSPAAGVADALDYMYGDGGSDLMAGDNADLCDGKFVLFDVAFLDQAAPAAATSGPDVMHGGSEGDFMYGQGKSELPISGDDGDDYIEGDTGADTLEGGDGEDNLVGGSGFDLGGPNGAVRELANVDDESVAAGPNGMVGDTINGGDEADHIAGDNARLSRSPRTLVLYDVAIVGGVPVDGRSNGNDLVNGNAGPDVMYGQGDSDVIHGHGGDDYAEGNNAVDYVEGEDGQDDLVGGSGRDDGGPNGTVRHFDRAADDADIIHGGNNHDFLLGDNGNVTRPGTVNATNGAWVRNVELYDVELASAPPVSADVHGPEIVIEGGDGDDTVFGQGDKDLIEPANGDDYAEGNHGADLIRGGAGQDDLVGGGSANDGVIDADRVGDGLLDEGDEMYGELDTSEGTATGNGADVVIGDNGRVDKVVEGLAYKVDPGSGDFVRAILLADLEDVTGPPADPRVHGPETLYGNDNDDIVRGQGDNDTVYGGAGDDDLEGNPATDKLYGQTGQDDMIGGSRAEGRRDAGDFLYGGPDADYQLGDNGTLTRSVLATGYQRFVEANATTITRVALRFDVGGSPLATGADWIEGNDGDDYQWGQDGNDELHGNDDNDDMFGELGNDRMFGENGEDAMLGDRGGVVDRRIDGSPGDPASFTLSINPTPRITYVAFRHGQLDRRFDLLHDSNAAGTGFQAALMAGPGLTVGGNDFMRGGPGRDSMHGGAADDLMNGDSAGDVLFGDDGSDVMWGGRGCDPSAGNACGAEGLSYRGAADEYVDYLFGGRGGSAATDAGVVTGGADILDYRPRPGVDPAAWFDITDTGAGDADPSQHHQGVDWMYGGWDRDVMQGDITANGPNDGDKMLDWVGAYNLYTACNAAYGGFNDVREHSPHLLDFLQRLSYALGAGPVLADVTTAGRSGFNELALVYPKDAGDNSGKAYPTTPGHFESFSCAP